MRFETNIISTITEYHALSIVGEIGLRILGIIFIFLLIQQLTNLVRTGQADFFSPVINVMFAAIFVSNIGYIGKLLAGMAHDISAEIYPPARDMEALFEFLGGRREEETQTWYEYFNLNSIHIVATTLTFMMMMIKILVIDLLWQILFSLAVLVGALSIPLSLIFGGGLKSWVKAMIEYTLWPIVFSVLILMMNESIRGLQAPDTLDTFEQDTSRILIAAAVIVLSVMTPVIAKGLVNSDMSAHMAVFAQNQVYKYSMMLYQQWPEQAARFVAGSPRRAVNTIRERIRKRLERFDLDQR